MTRAEMAGLKPGDKVIENHGDGKAVREVESVTKVAVTLRKGAWNPVWSIARGRPMNYTGSGYHIPHLSRATPEAIESIRDEVAHNRAVRSVEGVDWRSLSTAALVEIGAIVAREKSAKAAEAK